MVIQALFPLLELDVMIYHLTFYYFDVELEAYDDTMV
jgi:hypothetical protein